MKLYVRIFQFVHIRLVPLWCTYYICSLFQDIYGDVTVLEPGLTNYILS